MGIIVRDRMAKRCAMRLDLAAPGSRPPQAVMGGDLIQNSRRI
jgi:hypothetical protein